MRLFFRVFKKTCLLLVLSGLFATSIMAQTETDALRYSTSGPIGTARSIGLGGAFSAVGGDLSAASLNPAGFGFYNQSSFVLSPMLRFINTETQFIGSTGNDNSTNFSLPAWGAVFTQVNYTGVGRNRQPVTNGVVSYSFGVGVNQIDHYNRQFQATAYNPVSSVSDFFSERGQGVFYEDLTNDFFTYEGLAWNTFGIDTIAGGDGFTYFPAVNDGRIEQRIRREDKGRTNEWFIAGGANISDILYLGASLGIRSVRYEQTLTINERDVNNLHEVLQSDPNQPLETPFEQLEFRDEFSTRGTGINARFGLILRPIDAIRIGAAFQTPTLHGLTDDFTTSLSHTYKVVGPGGVLIDENSAADTPPGSFAYDLVTPWMATFGVAGFIQKFAFVSVDVDLVDYRSANFRIRGDDFNTPTNQFSGVNQAIEELYQFATNVRGGVEIRLDPFRLRGGYSFYGSAYSEQGSQFEQLASVDETVRNSFQTATATFDGARRYWTAGFGIRQPIFFIDVTYVNRTQNDVFTPYVTQFGNIYGEDIYNPTAEIKKSSHQVVLTLGTNF